MRQKNISKWFAGIAMLLAAPLLVSAQQGESHIGKVTGHADSGKQLYFRYCWGCHGFRGDGNGENWLPTASFPDAPYLNIQPRNFTAAALRLRQPQRSSDCSGSSANGRKVRANGSDRLVVAAT